MIALLKTNDGLPEQLDVFRERDRIVNYLNDYLNERPNARVSGDPETDNIIRVNGHTEFYIFQCNIHDD